MLAATKGAFSYFFAFLKEWLDFIAAVCYNKKGGMRRTFFEIHREVFMKKLLSLSLAFLLVFSLLACTPSPPEISDGRWSLASVSQADEHGAETLLYVSEEYVEIFGEGKDVARIDCRLSASFGSFTIKNRETGEVYEGIYENEDEFSPDAMCYDIVINKRKGRALAMRAADGDGDDFYTLSLTVKDYTLFFIK